MENNKKWIKISDGNYSLVHHETVLGAIDRLKTKDSFNAILANEKFKISTLGFLAQKLEITDMNGNVVLKMSPKKWYSSTFFIEFNHKTYTLVLRNNPLSEYVILSEKEELLAYGLDNQKGDNKLSIRISEKDNNQPLLFHLLLWYLFEPIAHENSGDSISFVLLTVC